MQPAGFGSHINFYRKNEKHSNQFRSIYKQAGVMKMNLEIRDEQPPLALLQIAIATSET